MFSCNKVLESVDRAWSFPNRILDYFSPQIIFNSHRFIPVLICFAFLRGLQEARNILLEYRSHSYSFICLISVTFHLLWWFRLIRLNRKEAVILDLRLYNWRIPILRLLFSIIHWWKWLLGIILVIWDLGWSFSMLFCSNNTRLTRLTFIWKTHHFRP